MMILITDKDPETKTILEAAATVSGVCSFIVTGSTFIKEAVDGKYNYILSYI